MSFFGVIILAALLLLAVFSLANWSVLSAPATLSFIVFDIEGLLGVILLGAILILVGFFVLYALTLRTNMLMESRRHNQELQAPAQACRNSRSVAPQRIAYTDRARIF